MSYIGYILIIKKTLITKYQGRISVFDNFLILQLYVNVHRTFERCWQLDLHSQYHYFD